jgi:hypothetical protein
MNKLQTCSDEMNRCWQSFASTWSATRATWKDTDADQFEREHINELQQASQAYIASLRKLAETVQSLTSRLP